MTIKSDLKQINNFEYDNTLKSWWKYSNCKSLTLMSLGAFWDFRNNKSDSQYKVYVDKILNVYVENILNVSVDRGGHYLVMKNSNKKFWIANKYYSWRLEGAITSPHRVMYLTIKQISKLDKILRTVEVRDGIRSSLV